MQLMKLFLKKIKGLNNLLPLHDLSKTEFIGRTGITETFLIEADNIDITDESHIRRREGFVKKINGSIHSLWSDGKICLFREGEYLKRLYKDYSISTLVSGLNTSKVSMDYINILGTIYYSDAENHGVIENEKVRDWIQKKDLQGASLYSADPKRYSTKTRKMTLFRYSPLPMGNFLEYFNGRLFCIQGNMIWYSESFAYEICDLSSNYIHLAPINLFAAVQDGIWVGTDREIYFMKGDNPPFTFIKKAEYGAIKGTQRKISGEYIGRGIKDPIIIWGSSNGICVGANGGIFENLTYENYSFPQTLEGSSIFIQKKGINQFIINFRNPQSAENYYI